MRSFLIVEFLISGQLIFEFPFRAIEVALEFLRCQILEIGFEDGIVIGPTGVGERQLDSHRLEFPLKRERTVASSAISVKHKSVDWPAPGPCNLECAAHKLGRGAVPDLRRNDAAREQIDDGADEILAMFEMELLDVAGPDHIRSWRIETTRQTIDGLVVFLVEARSPAAANADQVEFSHDLGHHVF